MCSTFKFLQIICLFNLHFVCMLPPSYTRARADTHYALSSIRTRINFSIIFWQLCKGNKRFQLYKQTSFCEHKFFSAGRTQRLNIKNLAVSLIEGVYVN